MLGTHLGWRFPIEDLDRAGLGIMTLPRRKPAYTRDTAENAIRKLGRESNVASLLCRVVTAASIASGRIRRAPNSCAYVSRARRYTTAPQNKRGFGLQKALVTTRRF